jgi:putative flavoprotein involved in K+ transport
MVTRAEPVVDGGFQVRTRAGDLSSRALVLATGAFQRPHRPAVADSLPMELPRINADAYRSEQTLPTGRVLVVGSGQSGAQITEELCEKGRDVVLACGRTSWLPRRLGDRDIVWWLDKVGFFDQTMESLSTQAERLAPNPLATGRSGGHDLDLRILGSMGVTLAGHFMGVENGVARFASDLLESVAWGDRRYRELMGLIERYARKRKIKLPRINDPRPFTNRGPEQLDISTMGIVIFAGGFRPGFRSWYSSSEPFDDLGFPLQREGASAVVPGLFFVGAHFQRNRKSALLFGVGEDASIVSRHIGDFLARGQAKG